MSTVQQIYDQLVERFISTKNKDAIINMLISYINECILNNDLDSVFLLKKKMLTEFAIDVGCSYKSNITNDFGCDLREILYNMDAGTRDNTNKLIQSFNRAYHLSEKTKLHILTDIDDTLYPNIQHHTYLAGSDISWHQHTPFPGVISFYRTLYRQPFSSKYSTILSATPSIFKSSKLVNTTLQRILGDRFGFLQGSDEKLAVLDSLGTHFLTAITSRLTSLDQESPGKPNVRRHFRNYGDKKYQRFLQMKSIFPEFTFIFIGDNGQGDLLAAIQMLASDMNCIACIRMVCQDGINFKPLYPLPEVPGVIITLSIITRLFGFRNYYELAIIFNQLNIFNQHDVDEIRQNFDREIEDPINLEYKHLYDGITIYGPGAKNNIIKYLKNVDETSITLNKQMFGGLFVRKSKKKSRRNTSRRNTSRRIYK
jgi:hypothetical protein